jgi:hypothetical protein
LHSTQGTSLQSTEINTPDKFTSISQGNQAMEGVKINAAQIIVSAKSDVSISKSSELNGRKNVSVSANTISTSDSKMQSGDSVSLESTRETTLNRVTLAANKKVTSESKGDLTIKNGSIHADTVSTTTANDLSLETKVDSKNFTASGKSISVKGEYKVEGPANFSAQQSVNIQPSTNITAGDFNVFAPHIKQDGVVDGSSVILKGDHIVSSGKQSGKSINIQSTTSVNLIGAEGKAAENLSITSSFIHLNGSNLQSSNSISLNSRDTTVYNTPVYARGNFTSIASNSQNIHGGYTSSGGDTNISAGGSLHVATTAYARNLFLFGQYLSALGSYSAQNQLNYSAQEYLNVQGSGQGHLVLHNEFKNSHRKP